MNERNTGSDAAGRVAASLAIIVLVLASASARAGEVVLKASTALRTSMQELIPKFEQASGHTVKVEYGVTLAMQKEIAAGQVFDVGVMLDGPFDQLLKDGKFVAGSRVQLARMGQAVGMHVGGRKYDIATVDGFRQMLLQAKSIVITAGSSGVYFNELLPKLGLEQAVRPKVLSVRNADEAAEALTSGKAELTILPASEILPIRDAVVLGVYPEAIQQYYYGVGGLSTTATHLEPAKAFLAFIADRRNRQVYASKGLQPVD